MKTSYRYFDVVLACDAALPELEGAPEAGDADLRVQLSAGPVPLAETPDWKRPDDAPDRGNEILCARVGDALAFRFHDLADFVARPAEGRVTCHPLPHTPPETVRHMVLDQVLPRLLGQTGRLVVHASAVVGDEEALAFVGGSGWGKSTLATSFGDDGWSFLNDDCLLLETRGAGGALAIPSYAGARLWPDAVDALLRGSSEGAPIAHYSPKKRYVVPGGEARPHPGAPLRAVFLLNDPWEERTDDIAVETVRGADAVMTLVSRCFLGDPSDLGAVRALLAQAAEVVRRGVRVFSLRYPRDIVELPRVRAAVLEALSSGR